MNILIKDISKSFEEKDVIKNFNMLIESGSITAIVGANGSGKTTLVKCLSSLLSFDSGFIKINDYIYSRKNFYKLRHKTSTLLDGTRHFYGNLTLNENLKYFCLINNINLSEKKKKIEYIYHVFKLNDYKDKLFSKVSRGTQQKLAILSCLIKDSDLLIMDEPSVALDMDSLAELKSLLHQEKNVRPIIISSHDINLLSELIDNIYILQNGETKFNEKIDNGLENISNLLNIYGITTSDSKEILV